MNWIDTIIIIIIGVTVFNGMRRGLIASVFDIISLIIAIFGSWRYGTIGIELFLETLKLPPVLAQICSYGLTGITIYAVGALIGAIIHKLAASAFPPGFDILGGGILGAVKGSIFASIIFVPLVCTPSLPIDMYTALQESRVIEWTRPTIEQRIPQIGSLVMGLSLPAVQAMQ